MAKYIYVASQDTEGGIARYTLAENGKLTQVDFVPLDRPCFLAAEENQLHAILREPFRMQSGVVTLPIHPDGSLGQPGPVQSCHAAIASHIIAWKGKVYTANYFGGSVIRLPELVRVHNGSSVNAKRQECAHPHCLTVTPDDRYVCINDLGTDYIYVCNADLQEISRVQCPAGSGPRHLAFSRDGRYAYAANELNSTVSVFAYEEGVLRYLAMHSTIPEDYTGNTTASAVRVSADGKTLFVSNRGHDSVCIFDLDGETLTNRRFIMTQGASPREVNLDGDYLLCGNENSATITVFNWKTGEQTDTVAITRPWCILPLEV